MPNNPLLLKIYLYYLLNLPYNLPMLRRSLIRNNPIYSLYALYSYCPKLSITSIGIKLSFRGSHYCYYYPL